VEPVVPAEMFNGAAQLVVYLIAVFGALLSFMLTART